MLNNNKLIKIGLLTVLIAFGVIGVFAIGGVSVSSLVYGQQQGTGSIQLSLIHDTFFLGFRELKYVGFQIPSTAENVVLSGQYKINGVAHYRSICCGWKSMRPRNGSQFMSGSVSAR